MKREFNLFDVLLLLKKRWLILVFCGILVSVGAFFYSEYTYEPTYTTTVDVLVKTGKQDNVNEAVSGISLAQKSFRTCIDLLDTYDFMDEISAVYKERYPDDWTQTPYSGKWIKNHVTFSSRNEESTIFKFAITTKSKDDSLRIGEIFKELAPDKIDEYQDNYSIEISDSPRRAESPSNSKNLTRNSVLGFLIGVILAFLAVFIVDISDIRIKKESDILENYSLPLLGTIPNFEVSAKSKKGSGYGYGKKV